MYRDYALIVKGHRKRLEQDRNNARNIMFYIRQFAGMGTSESTTPNAIWPLDMDEEEKKQMITNMAMAMELLKEF